MKSDESTLFDVVRAARLIVEFSVQTDAESIEDDLLIQSAILHQLLVMGEAVKRLSDTFRQNHPDVPWRLIARMRDRLIHGYDDVDLEMVWTTVESDVPEILEKLAPLLRPDE